MEKEWEFPELGIKVTRLSDTIEAEIEINDRDVESDLWLRRTVEAKIQTPVGEYVYPASCTTYVNPYMTEKRVEEEIKELVEKPAEAILDELLKKLKLFNNAVGAIRKVYGREVRVVFKHPDC